MKKAFLLAVLLLLIVRPTYSQKRDAIKCMDSVVQKVNSLDKKIEDYNEKLNERAKLIESEFKVKNDYLDYKKDGVSWWLTIVGILVAVFGVLIPIGISITGFVYGRKLFLDISNQKKEVDDEILKLKKESAEVLKFKDEAKETLANLQEYDKQGKNIIDDTKILIEQKKTELNEIAKQYDAMQYQTKTVKESDSEIETDPMKIKLSEAANLYSQKKYNECVALYQDLVKNIDKFQDDNDKLEIYFNSAYSYYMLSKYNLSHLYYNRVIEINPTIYNAYSNRGLIYSIKKEYDNAIEDYTKSIEHKPNAFAYNNRAATYSYLHKYKEAIEDYSKSINLDPFYAKAYTNRGIAFKMIGELEKALGDFNMAVELDENNKAIYFNRALIYSKLDNIEQSILDYEKYLTIDNSNVTIYLNLSEGLIMMNDIEKADNYLDNINRKDLAFNNVFAIKFLKLIIEILKQNSNINVEQTVIKLLDGINAKDITWSFDEMKRWLNSNKSNFLTDEKKRQISEIVLMLEKVRE